MEMLLVKTETGFRGYTAAIDRDYQRCRRHLKRMKLGAMVRMGFSTPRHLKHHQKFIMLASLVAETSETFDNLDKALCAVKVAAGHCDFIANTETGELIAVPRSISFANMEQEEFDVFYQNAVNGVLKHLLPTMTRIEFDEALERVANF